MHRLFVRVCLHPRHGHGTNLHCKHRRTRGTAGTTAVTRTTRRVDHDNDLIDGVVDWRFEKWDWRIENAALVLFAAFIGTLLTANLYPYCRLAKNGAAVDVVAKALLLLF